MKQCLKYDTFLLFQSYLVDRSGIYITEDRQDGLAEKLRERIVFLRIDTFESYLAYLKENPKGPLELKALLNILTIGETYFFRNEPHFKALENYILPKLIKSKNRTLRLWCAGCSTGEEPYSLAMFLREKLPDFSTWSVSILATDINQKSLQASKKGIYGERSVNYVPCDWLGKYFQKDGKKFQLSTEIKNMVDFEYHNLASDPFHYPGMQDLDLLFCRNVTIYFDIETLKKVVSQFSYCLKNEGHFFIGHSETLWGISSDFQPIELDQTFIYKKKYGKDNFHHPVNHFPSMSEEISGKWTEVSGRWDFTNNIEKSDSLDLKLDEDARFFDDNSFLDELDKAFDYYKNKKYEEALKIFDDHLLKMPHNIPVLMARATIYSDKNFYEKAITDLDDVIECDNLYAPAHFLMGHIRERQKKFEAAIDCFRRVVYIDESLSIAYLYLGNIYRYRGDLEKAKKEYSNCIKSLEGKRDQDPIDLSEDMTVGILAQSVYRAMEALKL